jgi:hypothetical protein
MLIARTGDLVYGSWFDHVLGWYRLSQKRPDRILFVTYEQLSQDLTGSIGSIGRFLNRPLDSGMQERLAKHCSFAQMRHNRSVNREDIPISDFFDQSQVRFMRKGVIGDWRNHFNSTQSAQFDRLFDRKMAPNGLRMAFTSDQATALYALNSAP